MKISLATGALPLYPSSLSMWMARTAGFDGVEVLLTPHLLRRGPVALQSVARRFDIDILTIHSQIHVRPPSFEQLLDDAIAAVRFADQLEGCSAVTAHYPELGREEPAEHLYEWLSALQRVVDARTRRDLRVSIENRPENNNGVAPQRLDVPDEIRAVAARHSLNVTLDLAHAASMAIPLTGMTGTLGSAIANVHISDANRRRLTGGIRNGLFRDHQAPGRGVLPLELAVRTLIRIDYEGPITLELNPFTTSSWFPPLALMRLTLMQRQLRHLIETSRRIEGASAQSTSISNAGQSA